MGSCDPRGVARSKRGIAGSIIMTVFDQHCLADFMRASTFVAKANSIETSLSNPYKRPSGVLPSRVLAEATQTLSPFDAAAALKDQIAQNITAGDTTAIANMGVSSPPMYTDQLMPFDATLLAANEYGTGAGMRILGLEILNEGSGVSIDDTSNEVQMTYIARLITPWVRQTVTFSNTNQG